MLDIDLKFHVDISNLFQEFKNFDQHHMIEVGNDLAPHYWIAFRHYRAQNPGQQLIAEILFNKYNYNL